MPIPQWLLSRYLTPAQQLASGGRVEPAPTIDDRVQQLFGMQPDMDRLNLLPRHDKNYGWVAPEVLYQLARAAAAPGVAASGGDVSPEDAVNFAGNLAGSSLAASAIHPVEGAGVVGQTVFHGSPHRFDAFDINKIGTGEGAQAYGHGLYVAEHPEVARGYATKVGRNTYDGGAYNNTDPRHVAASFLESNDQPTALQSINESIARIKGQNPIQEKLLRQAKKHVEQGTAAKFETTAKPTFYHVDLPDEHIEKMLDWDKPLHEQSPHVKKTLRDAGWLDEHDKPTVDLGQLYDPHEQVLALYDRIAGAWSGDKFPALSAIDAESPPAAASKYLHSIGIPGIKYYDSASRRAAPRALSDEGLTRNYVVFDDKLLKILKQEAK